MSFVCNPLKGMTEVFFTDGIVMKAATASISLCLRRQEAAIFQQQRFPLHYQTASVCKFVET